MRSKATTYLLLLTVATVWGLIAWKLFSPSASGVAGPAAVPSVATKDVAEDTLSLNYRDPFLSGGRALKPVPPSGPVMHPLPPPPAAKKSVKHNIRYIGRIRRQGVEYSLAEINGDLHTVRPGEQIDNYRLDNIFADSLHFSFDGERIIVKLAK